MAVVYSNNASTALSSGITNSATSITVGSLAGFPTLTGSDYYYATLANVTNTKIEIVKVTAAAGTTLTVVRGQDNTTAVSFDASDNLQLRVTAATLESATSTDVAITGGSIAGSVIDSNTIGADALNVSGNGTAGQYLGSDADGTFTWTSISSDPSMGGDLSGTASNAQIVANAVTDTELNSAKLNGIDTSANNYTHPTGAGYNHIPTGGSVGQILKNTASGTATWQADNNTTYSVGDGGLTQKNFTTTLKDKLDGIATSANNYSHPSYNGDDFSVDTGALSGATVVSDIDINVTTDTSGHVTDANGTVSTRNLTLANLGYTGATNANYITNNNQLTNGAGYITSYTNTTYTADGNYGMTLSGTTFRLENDRRRNSSGEDVWSGNTHDFTWYDANVGIRWYTANAEDMRLTDGGDLHVDGNVTAYSTTVSDRNLKTDIKNIDNALDKVNKLNGCTFTYTSDGKESAGLIAQEVEEVLPSAVTTSQLVFHGEEGKEYKVLQYDQTIGLLVEAIKELSAKVEELENR